MVTNNKCILAYGLNKDYIEKIESQNIKVIEIKNSMVLMTLEDIIHGNKNEDFCDELKFKETALIFNGFKEQQLKTTIRYIRGFVQGGVLAVSTPQNYRWTFKYLLEHLIEEREWFQQQKGRK